MTLTPQEAHALRDMLAPYQRSSAVRALVEIGLSFGPLALLWACAWVAVGFGLWWLALPIAIPSAGFVVRLFAVQHDCGHRSFFKSAWLNDWVGRILGVVTLTPHDCWRRTHGIHHATAGDLDRNGIGAVATLSVAQFRALSPLARLGYRIYRHPLILFVLGPFFIFFLQQRLPVGLMREGWRPWTSAMATNAGLAVFIAGTVWLGGWQGLLLVYLPTMLLAASIGVWLFYVQHQFEHTYWARRGTWNATEAALHGSSHYDLPGLFRWLTANIGVHHVHHLSSRIPSYRLWAVLKDFPMFRKLGRISLLDSIRCVGLALWDEAGHRLISFRQFSAAERLARYAPLVLSGGRA